jgi:ribonuclease Y
VDDEAAFGLARNLAAKVENELQYPGQIRITVIRETRCVEVAK